MSVRVPLDERFWPKVDRRGPDECWPWKAKARIRPGAYGLISSGGAGGPLLLSHRVAWMLTNGPIPEGMQILHRCDNPECCNPKHLRPGTRSENAQDASERGQLPKGSNHRNAKLNEAAVLEIKRLCRGGGALSLGDAGQLFGVSASLIHGIVHGRRWAHVTVAP